ncbi:MAG: 50S ribosomal protein L10 [Candidatus Aenigmatarchaeota archaeon]
MVSEEKIKKVEELKKTINEFPVIGIMDLFKLPSNELQEVRRKIKDFAILKAVKKRLLKLALEKSEKENLEKLVEMIPNQACLILSRENAFKLYSLLSSFKISMFAKKGDVASEDIKISAGVTNLPAGPVISELTRVGIPVGIEGGRIAIKKDFTIVKKGEVVSEDVANALRKLEIKPIVLSLNVLGIYEGGKVYEKGVLELVKTFPEKINEAYQNALNLSVNICYPTRESIKLLIVKAFNYAKAIERIGGVN